MVKSNFSFCVSFLLTTLLKSMNQFVSNFEILFPNAFIFLQVCNIMLSLSAKSHKSVNHPPSPPLPNTKNVGLSKFKLNYRRQFYFCDHLPRQSRFSTTLKKKAFENTEEKGENAGNQYFLLFPQCFLLYQAENSSF